MKSMRRDQGVSKTESELEKLVTARLLQKDFLVTDSVCKELNGIGYNLYAYLKKM